MKCKLGDYIRIKHGFAFKGEYITAENNGVVLVTPGNFEIGGGFKEDKCKYFNGDYPKEYVLSPYDLIVTMTDLSKQGDTLGYSALVPKTNRVYLHNQRIGLVDVYNPKADKMFIYWLMRTQKYQKTIVATSSGSTVKHTSPSRIYDVEVDLPPIDVQKKIAAILSALDEKIAINRAINENLLAQAQMLYKQCFPYGVQDDLPNGWRIGTVGEIIEIHDSKRIPLSGADRSKMEKKIYPYYGAASLMDLVDNYIFDGKYLLLGEDGTVVDDAGYPILQYVWGQFWVNNHAHILTGRLGYDVESLYMLFKQTPVKSIVTGAVQPKISQANLRSVQVVIPPEHNLREYNDLVEPLFSLFRANEEECKNFTALRDTLLPKLMSGEIDVSTIQL